MKKLISFAAGIAFVLIGFSMSSAQDQCEPLRTERTVVYEMFNKKDKFDGTFTHSYSEIEYDGSVTKATITVSMSDKKGKESDYQMSYELECSDGQVKMSMGKFITPEMSKAMGDGMEMAIEADDLNYPTSFSVGQNLGDGSMTAEAQTDGGGMKFFKISADVSDRIVEAKESFEIEGVGATDAYKISSKVESKMKMGPIKVFGFTGTSFTWWSPEHGIMVQQQDLDKKGRVRSTMKLKSIS